MACSGEETHAFYRLLSLGHRIVYTPDALAWHRHRRDMPELREQLQEVLESLLSSVQLRAAALA